MKVFVECNPDEILARALRVPNKILYHNNDKGRVCNSLEKKCHDSIGMVDEDPGSSQPTYISKLQFVEERFKVKVLIDKKRNNKLIIIRPRLEEWILEVAKDSKIDVSKFGLNNSAKELHRILGSKADKLKPLLTELLKLKSPAILYLQSQLSTLPNGSLTK